MADSEVAATTEAPKETQMPVSDISDMMDRLIEDWVDHKAEVQRIMVDPELTDVERIVEFVNSFRGSVSPLLPSLAKLSSSEVDIATKAAEARLPFSHNDSEVSIDLGAKAVKYIMEESENLEISKIASALKEYLGETPEYSVIEQAFYVARLEHHAKALGIFTAMDKIKRIINEQILDFAEETNEEYDGIDNDYSEEQRTIELQSGYSREYIIRQIQEDLNALSVEYDPEIFEEMDVEIILEDVSEAIINSEKGSAVMIDALSSVDNGSTYSADLSNSPKFV